MPYVDHSSYCLFVFQQIRRRASGPVMNGFVFSPTKTLGLKTGVIVSESGIFVLYVL